MFSLAVILKSLAIEMENSKAAHQRCFQKYAANLQENTHADM